MPALSDMTNARTIGRLRFPPWQVHEIDDGYAVEDAQGHRLGTFYGRSNLREARAAGLLTLEEARASALDFARLVELLNRELDGSDADDAWVPVNGSVVPEPVPVRDARRRHGRTDANRGRGVRTRAK